MSGNNFVEVDAIVVVQAENSTLIKYDDDLPPVWISNLSCDWDGETLTVREYTAIEKGLI